MRRVALIVSMATAILSGAASAQDWVGTGLATAPSTNDGQSISQFFNATQNLGEHCSTPSGDLPPPCGPNAVQRYDANIYGWVNGSYIATGIQPYQTITELPATLNLNWVGVQVSGYFPDPNSQSGLSSVQGVVPLSAFMRAGQPQTDPALTSQVTSLTATVAGVSNQVADLSLQVSGLASQVGSLGGQIAATSTRVDGLTSSLSAQDSRISALSGRTDALDLRLQALGATQQSYVAALQRQQRQMANGVSLASSLSMVAPAGDAHNRLGVGFGTFAGSSAMSLNYTHQSGNLDFGAAAAFSGGDSLAKASFGVSW